MADVAISRKAAIVDAAGLVCLWLLSIALVNPAGEFPLNDDWVYVLPVQQWFAGAGYRPHDWSAVPFLTNALWGGLFGLPFGPSFLALRISTLAAGLIGVLAVYALARAQGCSRWLTRIIALTFAFNPVAYALSYTFMTDTVLAVVMIVSAVFLARDMRRASGWNLAAGTLAAVAATLARQPGAAVPLAFFVATALQNWSDRRRMIRAVVPIAVSLAALVAYNQWLSAAGRLPAAYAKREGKLLSVLGDIPGHAMSIVTNVHFVALTLGLFLLPVLIVIGASLWSSGRIQRMWISAAVVVMALLSVVRYAFGRRVLMPILRNVLHASGLGPLTLRDTYILQLPHVPPLPRAFWMAATALAIVGAGCLLAMAGTTIGRLWTRVRAAGVLSGRDAVSLFLLLAAAIYLTPVLIAGLFDRYLIPVVPLVAIGLAGICSPRNGAATSSLGRAIRVVQVAAVVVMCVFTIGATHDYLSWNRARWTAARDLMRTERVGPERIDGGFEFNGTFLFDAAYVEDPAKSWWWVHDDTYQLSFGPVAGYETIREYRYRNWMLPREGRIVVQRRLGSAN